MPLFQRTLAPILTPENVPDWAAGAVFNPGAWYDGEQVHLLFRAVPDTYRRYERPEAEKSEGTHGFENYISTIGYASSRDGVHFDVRHTPLIEPDAPFDRFGAEDARVSCLDGTHYITYTALEDDAFAPGGDHIGIGLATTRDFRHVQKHGRVGPPVRDKDAVIFPGKIRGRVAMLHRIVPDIQIAYFEDEAHLQNPGAAYWEAHLRHLDEHVVMRPQFVWEGKKIGAGPTPIETPEGWLLLYHGADRGHVYRAGLALLDRDDPQRVIARTSEPVMSPELPFELEGDVPNVVFPEGAVVIDGTLHVYYGGADKVVGHAQAPLADVVAHVLDAGRQGWPVARVHFDFRGDREEPRAWPADSPVPVERLHGGMPVLENIEAHEWESRVVLNPAGVLVEGDALETVLEAWSVGAEGEQRLRQAGGAVALLYRAQGSAFARPGGHIASSLGLALCTPTLEVVYRHPTPIITPEAPFHDLGVEDARCSLIGDTFYLYYTGYTSGGKEAGADGMLEGRVHLCLATSKTLRDWTLHGPMPGDLNTELNKNGALVPEPVDGKWLFLHRPMSGTHPMAMHLATAEAPEGPFHTQGRLASSYRYDDFALSWVGAAGPPHALGEGRFVALYHQGHFTYDGRRFYNLSAMLLDFSSDEPVRARIEPILVPTGAREQVGDPRLGVDNVVFSCASYRWKDDLVIPYAGADSRIFGARLSWSALVEALEARAAVAA